MIACFNSILADQRTRTRAELLETTEAALEKIARRVAERSKMAKHFETSIAEGAFSDHRKTQARHGCHLKTDPEAPAFQQITVPTLFQSRAFQLLDAFPGPGKAKP